LYYETRLSLSVFKRLLSLLASIVLATLPLADDETPLNSKREGSKIGLEDDIKVMDLRVEENQRFEIKVKSHYTYLAYS